MTRITHRMLAAITPLVALACAQDMVSLGEGADSQLTVRAYVDVDGNGAYTDGTDVPIGSVTIAASGDAGEVSSETDATGTAILTLAPGSYELSLSGTVPSGAVLATASNPQVAAPFQGATLTAEFRYGVNPGSITGAVFRDDDSSGTYDPASDTPAGGLEVSLHEGTDTSVAAVATTTTAADGTYSFTDLRPGTWTLVFTPFPTITMTGGNTLEVTVTAEAAAQADKLFSGSLVITMAEARNAANGDRVTIEGIITFQAPWRRTLDAFVQDSTGAFALFDFGCDFDDPATNCPEVQIGDQVQVSGVKGDFNGEVQLASISLLQIIGQPGAPQAIAVSGADVNVGAHQGELVNLYGKVDSVLIRSFGNQTVFMTDPMGTHSVALVDSRTGIDSLRWVVGAMASVTGNVGFDSTSSPRGRLEPRDTTDLAFDTSLVTVAAARGMNGSTVTIEGVVTWEVDFDTRVYFFQDGTGGITTFDTNVEPTLQRGDRILVTGDISSFRSEVQISPSAVQVIGREAVPTPRAITATELNAGMFQGELVTLSGTVDSVLVLSFDNHTVWLHDGSNVDFHAYVDSRTGVGSADWAGMTGQAVQLVGVIGNDDRDTPAARVELRGSGDFYPTTTMITDIASARGQVGDTVTVEGVVTWDVDFDSRVWFFQDDAGGLTVFYSAGDTAITQGDRVRVTGEVSTFRSEVQVSPVLSVQRIGTEAVPFPRGVTAAEINAGMYQGELVTIAGTVDSLQTFSFDNHLVFLTDGNGATFTVYGDSRTGQGSSDWTVGALVQVTGVLGNDDRDTPQQRVEIRSPADVR